MTTWIIFFVRDAVWEQQWKIGAPVSVVLWNNRAINWVLSFYRLFLVLILICYFINSFSAIFSHNFSIGCGFRGSVQLPLLTEYRGTSESLFSRPPWSFRGSCQMCTQHSNPLAWPRGWQRLPWTRTALESWTGGCACNYWVLFLSESHLIPCLLSGHLPSRVKSLLHSSNQFHTQPGSSSTNSPARSSPVGRPVLPVPDRSTYCQLLGGGPLGGGLYSPTSPQVSQVSTMSG